MKSAFFLLPFAVLFLQVCHSLRASSLSRTAARSARLYVQKDAQGYEIKPRDWFNGLSLDPGGSLTDPRAVPPEARGFAEGIKSGGKVKNFDETIAMIDKHYNYFAVSFTNGDLVNAANTNTGSAKVFSFGLMTKMDVDTTLRLFGEHYDAVKANPSGSDHQNIRNFMKNGWAGITFGTGLAIASKLQSYDDTDSAFATQSSIAGKENSWDNDSESWIP